MQIHAKGGGECKLSIDFTATLPAMKGQDSVRHNVMVCLESGGVLRSKDTGLTSLTGPIILIAHLEGQQLARSAEYAGSGKRGSGLDRIVKQPTGSNVSGDLGLFPNGSGSIQHLL